MRIKLSFVLALFAISCAACTGEDDIKISYANGTVNISPANVEGVEFKTDGAHVKAIVKDSLLPDNHPTMRFILSGESMDGSFTVKSKDSTVVVLNGLNLTSRKGAPLWLRTKAGALLSVGEGKENIINLIAVTDTAKQKSAVVFANGNLSINGNGRLVLNAYADGCKGLNVKENLTIDDLKLDIATTGDNLGIDTLRRWGPPGDFGGEMPEFDMENMPAEVKEFFEKMKEQGITPGQGMPGVMPPMGGFPGGGRPEGGNGGHGGPGGFGGFPGGGMPPMGGMPGFGEGGPDGGFGGGFGGKQKYMGTCKGIKAGGVIVINSGEVAVTTESRGAEGIEGKKGVTVNGGIVNIKSMDDAISSNGRIIFNGGETTAWSVGNDAIDSNSQQKGAITIAGGKVFGFCQCGAPEEGFDSDFQAVVISGGTAFGIGGEMGGMTTKSSEEASSQPSILFSGLKVAEGAKVELFSQKDKKNPIAVIYEALPFSTQRSTSLFTCPALKVGEKYILRVGKEEKKFKMEKNFMTIGGAEQGGFGGFPGGFGGGFPGGGFPGGGMPGGGFPGGF